MTPLLGYVCHRASVALHGVAVRWITQCEQRDCWTSEPAIQRFGEMFDDESADITLLDVAPRLAAAIDWGRDKWVHVCWLAGMGKL